MKMTRDAEIAAATEAGHSDYCFGVAVERVVEDITEQGFTGTGEYDDTFRLRQVSDIAAEQLATGELACECDPEPEAE